MISKINGVSESGKGKERKAGKQVRKSLCWKRAEVLAQWSGRRFGSRELREVGEQARPYGKTAPSQGGR